jgi:hypothetical protein
MDCIIPERQRGRHWEGWDKVMASGETRHGRDVLAVTPRFQREKALRARLKELEAKGS